MPLGSYAKKSCDRSGNLHFQFRLSPDFWLQSPHSNNNCRHDYIDQCGCQRFGPQGIEFVSMEDERIIMKPPHNREEFLAWPPMGAAIAVIVFTTLHITLSHYHSILHHFNDLPVYTAYGFPIIMGVVLAWPLHPKYWLGFAWSSFVFYLCALFMTLFPASTVIEDLFLVCMSLSLLQAVQSGWLFVKRVLEWKAAGA